jgi:hypothetical protein
MRAEVKGFEAGLIGGAPSRRRPRRLSQLFAALAAKAEGRITMGSIRDALGDRSFAALLVLFGAINLIPLPPGASALLGLPLVVVAAQMMYGSKRAWLPKFIAEKSLTAETFRSIIDRVAPRLERIERFIRPRYWPFWRKRGDRIIGTISLVLAIIVTLPIPLGNWLPAFSITLLGLALTERDGILFAIGSAIGAASIALIVLVIGVAGAATHAIYGWLI